ncbi:Protein SCAF11 [Tupaia chinensis]|uniref:Protein SCAF11 n=1 Tax=Tupaia chinensis TaxID=246437 RepID=L8Y6T9_TUPCH|nr:Protein SCAF11 [Tupaia chinensis]
MKKKTVYTIHVGDQDYEDMEGEENRDNTAATGLLYSEDDRCPICLNCLLEKEVGFPDSCNHVFCVTCILKWAEKVSLIFEDTHGNPSSGTYYKGYAVAHTQEGEEKKQTSGTSNTRGSRRKPTATPPTRRSTRNMKAETVGQSQRSSVSSSSGCDAPGNSNPPLNVSSSAELEKQTRQAPKRKPVRRGRKPPLLKKKLRSSAPPPEKSSSSDSVDEEAAESDAPPMLEKEHLSDAENNNTCNEQTNVDNQPANCLKNCSSEQIEKSEEHTENNDVEKETESSHSESCTQDPLGLVEEKEEVKKFENTGIEDKSLCLKSDISKNIFEEESDALENQDQITGLSEVKADICTDNPPNDFFTCSGPEIEEQQSVSSPLSELPDNSELVTNKEKIIENSIVEIIDHKDTAVKIEEFVESTKLESFEGEIIQTVDKKSVESSDIEFLEHVKTERVPLMQVAAPTNVSQGLPPPPPPPPPSQQVNYIASQPDGKQLQGIPGASHVSSNMTAPVLPAPTAAPGNMGTVQGPSSGNTSSSSHSKASNAAVKLAESKKLQIQEKAAQEVKLAIKPFYQNKDITKEEYKEIVRKAVDKVCHSKSGEVNSAKVANLVKAYVDKYKYSRKGSQKKTVEEPVSTEKNIG